MAAPINPLGPTPVGPSTAESLRTTEPAPGLSFKDVLYESIQRVNQLQQEATQAAEDLVSGRTQDVGQVLVATQKADIAFKMLMEIRNKLLSAYDELRQMRV